MDARERLRRYLEQRRELGEQELVLDRLEVDDVLRMVGALGRNSPATGTAPEAGRPAAAPEEHPAGGRQSGEASSSGAPPERPAAASEEAPAGRQAEVNERASAEPAGSFSDWRETLRAAGGGPPGPVAPPPGGRRGENTEESEMAPRKKARKAAEDAPVAAGGDATAATAPKAAAGRATAGGAPAEVPSWVAELDIPVGLSVGKAGALDDTFARLRTLDELARVTEECTRCALYRTATHAVPGEGNPDADLVCVGEAPGANEDASGRPFVGAAGQLLTKILAAIKLSREDVFICNVLKHRPPGNRNPAPDEVEACSPYLLRQLELVRPRVILTLGTFASQTLLATKTPIGKLRGQVHLYHGIPLVVTYHPAALLRNSAWKRPTWEDVQLARRLLDSAPGA